MRAAARSAGATLLSLSPQKLHEPELIPTEDEGVYRLFDTQGGQRLVTAIRSPAWRYARLAQSGDTLFILDRSQRIARHTTWRRASATRCPIRSSKSGTCSWSSRVRCGGGPFGPEASRDHRAARQRSAAKAIAPGAFFGVDEQQILSNQTDGSSVELSPTLLVDHGDPCREVVLERAMIQLERLRRLTNVLEQRMDVAMLVLRVVADISTI